MSHVLPNISRGRFFEPIFTSKKFDLYTSIYGTTHAPFIPISGNISCLLYRDISGLLKCVFSSFFTFLFSSGLDDIPLLPKYLNACSLYGKKRKLNQ